MANSVNMQYYQSYNPNHWGPMYGQGIAGRYDYGRDSSQSFNQQYFDDIFGTKGTLNGLTNLVNNNRVGLTWGPKVYGSDFGRYLGLISDWATQYNLLTPVANANGNLMKIADMQGKGQIGPSLESIPMDNKDGNRIFTHVLDLGFNDQTKYKFKVTQDMLDATSAANGGPSEGADEIASNIEIWELTPDNEFLGEMKGGCIACRPNSCGKGYRQLFLMKNQYKNGNFNQGAYAGELVSEVVIVLDAQEQSNGNLRLTVRRGANGQTVDNGNGLIFQSGAITLEKDDFILVGTITPTTECLSLDLRCEMVMPKRYSFCNTLTEFMECLVCVSKTQLKTSYGPANELISRRDQVILTAVRNMQKFQHRVYNQFMYGDTLYAQNFAAPLHPTLPIGNEYDGELNPAGFKGLFRQFDFLSTQIEIPFKSCDQSCSEYVLKTIIDALDNGAKDAGMGAGNDWSAPGWMAIGDLKSLRGIQEARRLNFAPMTMADRQSQLDGYALTYSENPVSLFRKANSKDAKALNNEFERSAGNYGVQLVDLQIGRYTFKGIHDELTAYLEPGVIRFIHVPDITYFSDNLDQNMEALFGGQSPFLPATAVKGSLVPNVVSQSLAPVWLNGRIQNMAKDDCGMQFFTYMRAGLYLSPRNISRNLKVRLVGIKPNPAYPSDPNATPDYKVPLWELGCGCEKPRREIEIELDSWNGRGPVIDSPYVFFNS